MASLLGSSGFVNHGVRTRRRRYVPRVVEIRRSEIAPPGTLHTASVGISATAALEASGTKGEKWPWSLQAVLPLDRPTAPRLRSRIIRVKVRGRYDRAVTVDATANVAVSGVIVPQAARQISLDATASIAVAGTVTTPFEVAFGAAALDAIAALEAGRFLRAARSVLLEGTAGIGARGVRLPAPPPPGVVRKYPGRTLLVYREGVLVGQLRSISPVGSTGRLKDVTRYGATMLNYQKGAKEGNEVELVLAGDPDDTEQDALHADYDSRATRTFQVSHPDAGWALTFVAVVVGVWNQSPLDGLYAVRARLRILSIV